jgi:adenosylcobyric acid synthase
VEGLALLDVATEIGRDKTVREVQATDAATRAPLRGYEIHLGRTDGPALARPMLWIGGLPDGAVSADGRVAGCYLHGLLANDRWRADYLRRIDPAVRSVLDARHRTEVALDALAAHLEHCIDLDRLIEAAAPAPAAGASALIRH